MSLNDFIRNVVEISFIMAVEIPFSLPLQIIYHVNFVKAQNYDGN